MSNPALIGRNYENSLRTKLKTVFTSINKTAGFGTGPDIQIPSNNTPGQFLLVEAKTSTGADFGQKAITFDGTSWVPKYDGKEPQTVVNLYNYLYKKHNIDAEIKKSWVLPSNNLTPSDLKEIVENDNLSKVLYYEKLLKQATGTANPFPQTTIISGKEVVSNIISYYNSKGVYYLQIKGSGLYILGMDKLKLNSKLGISIPRFNPSTANLVVRGKPSLSNRTFRPTLTLKSGPIPGSNYTLEDVNFIRQLYQKL